jgi:hypothetical protein
VEEDDVPFLVRPSDLATLRIDSVNLEMDGTKVRRSTPGDRAAVIIGLPPQHFREHPRVPMDTVLDLAAAAPTSLVFEFPDDVDEIELRDDGLLGLCERLLLSPKSVIAVPARASLAPLDGRWQLSASPEVVAGRGSLWRAKLVGPVRDGAIRARLQLFDVADADLPAWDVLPSSAELRQRQGGVLEARRFDFSPIGVSARLRGPVDFGEFPVTPDLQEVINSYEHDIDFGRDSRVRLVSQGHLSSGHAASLIRLRRRIFIGGSPDIGFGEAESVAFLDTVSTIVITDPVVDVDQLAGAYGGPARDMPFRTLRMLTTHVSGMDDDAVAKANGLMPFWVQVGGQDFRFALQGTDWAGHVIGFDVPLVFIPGKRPFDLPAFSEVFAAGLAPRRTAGTGSASIALVAPETEAARAVAPMTVEAVQLGFQPAQPGVTSSPVLPVLSAMRVVVDAAAHFTGVRTAVAAIWHQAYRSSGLDSAANALGTYLQLPSPLPVSFGDPRRIGGLASPDMKVAALTVLKGAVPAGFDPRQPLSLDLIKQQFSTAKVLGVVPLNDIVDFSRLGPPELTEKVTSTSAELTYAFSSPIRSEGNPSVLKPSGPDAAIQLNARVIRRFADGATTASVSGQITKVAISVADIVTLRFASLEFKADPGAVPSVTPHGLSLSFDGDLSFLQTLSQALDDLGLGGITVRVGTDKITAGFATTVPALSMGMFSLTNLSVSALLTVPFDGRPVEFSFGAGERFKPFSVMVSLFTGGGFFALTMTSERVERVEAALEFGGSMQLNLVVASGGLSVMAGIYLRLDDSGVTLGGYLRASGQVTVLGIITISADFFMQLSYQEATGKAIGQASLTLGIKVLFFSKSVTLSIERKFSPTSGDPTFTDCFEIEDWGEYCGAFA